MASVESLERRSGCIIAARIGLASLLALNLATEGRSGEAQHLLSQEEDKIKAYGWAALTVGEQSEIYAFLALARHACSDLNSALQYLRAGIEPAPMLAARGDMQAFLRLCHAVTQILPPDTAARFWTQWLLAAAARGVRETTILLSVLIRHVREEDISRVTLTREGHMIGKEREAAEAQRQRSELYEFFDMSAGGSGDQ
jgi:hypothetical protein